MEITGPFGGNYEHATCEPRTYNFSVIDENDDESVYSFDNGKNIIDKLCDVKYSSLKTTTNTEKHNILKMFNTFVQNDQPISPGVYIISRLLLLDESHMDTFYYKNISFFVECDSNQLSIYDYGNSKFNINFMT
jgi:hypothetical protein